MSEQRKLISEISKLKKISEKNNEEIDELTCRFSYKKMNELNS